MDMMLKEAAIRSLKKGLAKIDVETLKEVEEIQAWLLEIELLAGESLSHFFGRFRRSMSTASIEVVVGKFSVQGAV
jgi:hypothetical protein